MKSILAILLCSAAPVALGSPPTERTAEPPAGANARPLPASAEIQPWPAEQRDGYFLEAAEGVPPSAFVPGGAIGLPPGTTRNDRGPVDPPHLAHPDRQRPAGAPRASRVPLLDDLVGMIPSKPVMQGFEGPGRNGQPFPACDLAVGPDHVMTVMHDLVVVYDKCGEELFSSDIYDFFGIDHAYTLVYPKIVFDPWHDRWVILCEMFRLSSETSILLFAVSQDETPPGLGNWWFYNFDAVQTHDGKKAYASQFELGFSNDHITLGGDMRYFSGGTLWARVWVIEKSKLYAGDFVLPLRLSDLVNPDGSKATAPVAARMQTSWMEGGENLDGLWINSRWYGGDKLTLWKITDAFGAYNVTFVDLDVQTYAMPPEAIQPNGKPLKTGDCSVRRAVVTSDKLGSNGIELFTSLTAERVGLSGTLLYKINPVAETVEYQWNLGAPGLYYFYACPVADYSGSAAWVFARTGESAGNEPETRFMDYEHGTLGVSSTQIRDGEGSFYISSWGPYYGAALDWGDYKKNISVPGRPAKMWMQGQYGQLVNWGTYVGATSMFAQGDLASVTPTSKYSISGPAGGPFTPSSRQYTLTNTGEVGLAYQVQDLPSWLDATPSSGQAYPGGTYVTLQVNAAAASLSPGVYTHDVRFQDCFNGGQSHLRTVELTVTGSSGAYCFCTKGNPSGNVAPCKNYNDGTTPPGGCRHDESTAGARLDVSGKASLGKDTLVLLGTRGPKSNSTLFFQANNNLDGPPQNYLGDGMRCAGGGLVRLQVRMTSSGAAQTTKSISARSASLGHPISPGETLYYQWWIRDPGGSPCGQESNTSNGYMITWGP